MKKAAKKSVKKATTLKSPVNISASVKKPVTKKAAKSNRSEYPLLQSLNDEQQQAASHAGGPLLIIAGAGTGKTTTLVHRVAWLIEQGVQPPNILLLTFTRRAAFEMYHRVETVLQQQNHKTTAKQQPGIWHGTFHAVATRFLRMYGLAIDLPRDFTILDRGDSEDMIASIRAEMGLDKSEKIFPKKGTCMTIYSLHVNSRVPVDKLVLERFPWLKSNIKDLIKIFEAYEKKKLESATLNYDDLLIFWLKLLEKEEIAKQIVARFGRRISGHERDSVGNFEAALPEREWFDGRR